MPTKSFSVAVSADDGYGENNTDFNNTATDVMIGSRDYGSGSKAYFPFLRFANVTIPNKAKIISAYLTVTEMDDSGSGTVLTKIYGEAADNPAAPTTRADVVGRVRTTAGVDWDITGGTWTDGTVVNSPEINTVIQEIVNRTGWVIGNALQILIDNDTGVDKRAWFASWDHATYTEPVLTITYAKSQEIIMF